MKGMVELDEDGKAFVKRDPDDGFDQETEKVLIKMASLMEAENKVMQPALWHLAAAGLSLDTAEAAEYLAAADVSLDAAKATGIDVLQLQQYIMKHSCFPRQQDMYAANTRTGGMRVSELFAYARRRGIEFV
jgi:hypothetical protein